MRMRRGRGKTEQPGGQPKQKGKLLHRVLATLSSAVPSALGCAEAARRADQQPKAGQNPEARRPKPGAPETRHCHQARCGRQARWGRRRRQRTALFADRRNGFAGRD